MTPLSKYSDSQLRAELDRRTRKAKNAQGFVRCKDCIKPETCKFRKNLKQGVWRICEDYNDN
jgi:hypothetical protein